LDGLAGWPAWLDVLAGLPALVGLAVLAGLAGWMAGWLAL
jgi:hypothetical protein